MNVPANSENRCFLRDYLLHISLCPGAFTIGSILLGGKSTITAASEYVFSTFKTAICLLPISDVVNTKKITCGDPGNIKW